jgi:dihydrolipoamide dehydrogenase
MKIVIIGGGPGGYVAAIRAAQLGAQVTVIEEDKVGGTCLHRGCIPTKSWVASVQVYEKIQKAREYGIVLEGETRWDFQKLLERTRSVVDLQHRGIRNLFKNWGIELLEGRGRLVDSKTVEVTLKEGKTVRVQTDRIILATGSRPSRLPLFPFDGQTVLTSDDALVLNQIPKTLLIVGAGVSGCEFACIFRLLGTKVTIVEMLPRCLSTEDEEIAAVLEREFKKTGIELLCNQRIESMQRTQNGAMVARLSDGQEIRADRVLVTIGRAYNTKDLGLETVGIGLGPRGQILVNEYMETPIPGVYAIGDVVGPPMLAHKASREGIIAVEHVLGTDPSKMDYRTIPSGTFTVPEIGSVGLTEQQALDKGYTLRIGRFHFRGLAKSHVIGEITGMIKVVSDAQNDRILGVHIIGPHATDLIHEAAVAMGLGAKTADMAQIVHAHPTLSEALLEAFEDAHGRAIHLPKKPKPV